MRRKLKIMERGDFWKKKTYPAILLQGKWLQEAGFTPNSQVVIEKVGESLILTQIKATNGANQ